MTFFFVHLDKRSTHARITLVTSHVYITKNVTRLFKDAFFILRIMDIVRNIKSMSLNQFLSLQVFEGVYVLALAFLPFLLAFRVVAYIILAGIALTTIVIGYRLLTLRLVNPEGKVVLITGCDSGQLKILFFVGET